MPLAMLTYIKWKFSLNNLLNNCKAVSLFYAKYNNA